MAHIGQKIRFGPRRVLSLFPRPCHVFGQLPRLRYIPLNGDKKINTARFVHNWKQVHIHPDPLAIFSNVFKVPPIAFATGHRFLDRMHLRQSGHISGQQLPNVLPQRLFFRKAGHFGERMIHPENPPRLIGKNHTVIGIARHQRQALHIGLLIFQTRGHCAPFGALLFKVLTDAKILHPEPREGKEHIGHAQCQNQPTDLLRQQRRKALAAQRFNCEKDIRRAAIKHQTRNRYHRAFGQRNGGIHRGDTKKSKDNQNVAGDRGRKVI